VAAAVRCVVQILSWRLVAAGRNRCTANSMPDLDAGLRNFVIRPVGGAPIGTASSIGLSPISSVARIEAPYPSRAPLDRRQERERLNRSPDKLTSLTRYCCKLPPPPRLRQSSGSALLAGNLGCLPLWRSGTGVVCCCVPDMMSAAATDVLDWFRRRDGNPGRLGAPRGC